jgi:low temperature requirement protein LtrA
MRLFTFLTMIPVGGLAIYAHHGLAENYRGFAVCYLLARAVNIFLWVRAGWHEPAFRPSTNRFAAGFVLATGIIIASLFEASVPRRIALWGLALLIEVAAPWLTVGHQATMPKISTSKWPERFGLLTLIVLGESIVGAINGVADTHRFTAETAVRSILGLAVGFALWWVYFDFVARRPFRHTPYAMFFWPYLHLPLTAAIAATGAGVLVSVENAGPVLPQGERLLVTGAVGAALVCIGLIELTLVRLEHEPTHPVLSPVLKVAGGAASIGFGLAATGLNTTALFGSLIALLGVQIAYGVLVWYRQEL